MSDKKKPPASRRPSSAFSTKPWKNLKAVLQQRLVKTIPFQTIPPPPQLTFPTVASPRPLHSSAENRLSTPLSQILAPSLGWHSDPTSNNGNGISSRKSKSPRPVDNFLHYKKVHIRLQRRQRYVCRICAIVLHFVMQRRLSQPDLYVWCSDERK